MTAHAVPVKPNPGSDEALSMGCLCPILDNGHGRMPPYPPDSWWITEGCPVHAPAEPRVRRIGVARDASPLPGSRPTTI